MSATRFNPAILISDPQRRARILPILDAALDAVDPGAAVQRMLTREGDLLRIAGRLWDLHTFQNVTVLSFGKAAVTMTGALCELLGDRISAGIALTKVGHAAGREQLPASIAVLEAGHPVPDEAGVAASRRIAELAEQAAHDDLVICLVSGGGSALLTYPAPGLSLADLQATTEALLRCGATIDQINTLRKHLEVLKGGQLARLVAPA
ncbi:MAG: glycerate-2-kinase family protein, partial [Anaerolineae bacterium]|nr:glycerate-2-kinase family protein [Anaerolineae bacterium]